MNNVKSQCMGITIKGERCKIRTDTKYCRYHQKDGKNDNNQDGIGYYKKDIATNGVLAMSKKGALPRPTISDEANKAHTGFIYIYTLNQIVGQIEKGENRLLVKNLPNSSAKDRDKWVPYKRGEKYILVKIGMTTKTVDHRLKQWGQKCGHKIQVLSPLEDSFSVSKIEKLVSMFRQVSLDDHDFKAFSAKSQGFFCSGRVHDVEKAIHKKLIELYGKGTVYCTGCSEQDDKVKRHSKLSLEFLRRSKNAYFQAPHNRHIEWFLIPRKDLKYVFRLIDSYCISFT